MFLNFKNLKNLKMNLNFQKILRIILRNNSFVHNFSKDNKKQELNNLLEFCF
jgi:hypothetical protein